jgi:hypothetical protein
MASLTLHSKPFMPSKTFTSGRIRQADFDTATGQLELRWDNGSALAYKQVPQEVFRRLCNAPNPAAYWEDRIAEEYPKGTPARRSPSEDAARQFNDLFGGGGDR